MKTVRFGSSKMIGLLLLPPATMIIGMSAAQPSAAARQADGTPIQFASHDPDETLNLFIYGTYAGDSFECQTPCVGALLYSGTYRVHAWRQPPDSGDLFFEVPSDESPQLWVIDPGSYGEVLGGITLSVLGFTGLLLGGMGLGMNMPDDPSLTSGLNLDFAIAGAVGAVATGLGIWLWVDGTGAAERQDVEQ